MRDGPSAETQLAFLGKIERLLSQGRFTTTYKFALLIALTNLAVEKGEDTNAELKLDVEDIARQFLALYWGMARPYPGLDRVLDQSTNRAKPSSMITLLGGAVELGQSSYARLRVYRARHDALITKAVATLKKDVLHRLQAIGAATAAVPTADCFLYASPKNARESTAAKSFTLKSGVSACLRQLRGVILAMVEARWARWVRERNQDLGPDRALESFLFGAVRSGVTMHAAALYDLQNGRCFYSSERLASPTAGEVDHFVPWSRYPCDSPFNLVLATRKVNNAKRDMLAAEHHRKEWLARNDRESTALTSTTFMALASDKQTVQSIADWIYAANARAGHARLFSALRSA